MGAPRMMRGGVHPLVDLLWRPVDAATNTNHLAMASNIPRSSSALFSVTVHLEDSAGEFNRAMERAAKDQQWDLVPPRRSTRPPAPEISFRGTTGAVVARKGLRIGPGGAANPMWWPTSASLSCLDVWSRPLTRTDRTTTTGVTPARSSVWDAPSK